MANNELTRSETGRLQRPVDVFDAMRNEMDRMFERFERGWGLPALSARGLGREMMVPELDVSDDGKQLKIAIDLPGMSEKDVSVTLANGVLTIKGERKSESEEKKENYYMSERRYGSFQRQLRLPDTIDDSRLEAKFDKGVLHVSAPKKPDAVKAEKKIEIKNG
jgi:HSP20 family protein